MKEIKKAGALIIRDKKLLIVKPKGKEYFINPGGKYEKGESPEECLKRELKEELSADLISSKYYKTYSVSNAAHSELPLSLDLYIVEITGEIKPSSEIEIFDWMTKRDFLNKKFNLAPSFYQYIPDLIKDSLV